MAWLAVIMVVVFVSVVVLRYGFGLGFIWLQESAQYLHAAIFLLASAGVIVVDGHVRVDVLRTRFSPRAQRRLEVVGHLLLLLPFAAFLLWASIPYAVESWRIGETSVETSGLPFVYLLKTLIPVAALQLAAQALASAWLLGTGAQPLTPAHHDEGL
ncbi:MAG: TRAP transporter small permease subunit [Algiphilus sp.]|uniref:TRAP transporter small permease subunit n=1 Tax=Algiphilus sp. TaxID=1872431 RepID=UPI0025BCE3A3|nr:TRAP transporter small permease subunit [Algiphilus sp.]MCI5063068.1 TRAP transporter small permease subunit [Algiphilus sp.]MCI5103937.1 TRAP transporter small permease subunit [Algiphilus sp.]